MLKRVYNRVLNASFPLVAGIERTPITSVISPLKNLSIKFEDWDKDLGAGSFWEVCTVGALIKRFNPINIVEIGTGHGRATLQMAINSSEQSTIYTFDVSDHPVVGSIFKNKDQAKKIHQITADSKSYDFSKLESKVDFVFVDGAHDYHSVLADSRTAFRLLPKNEGYVLWDDFSPSWPGVVKAIKEVAKDRPLKWIVGTSYVFCDNSADPG